MRYETHRIKSWLWTLALLISQCLLTRYTLAQAQGAPAPGEAAASAPQTLRVAPNPGGQGVSHVPPAPIFADFLAWSQKYQAATTVAAKAQLEPEGVLLATVRRQALLKLIVTDPAQALALPISLALRHDLPAAVLAQLEQRISGRGEYDVLAIDQFDATGTPKTLIKYSVIIKAKAYHAGVYGRRLGVTSKRELALHGIAIDNYMAVDESPIRRLEPGEVPDPKLPIGNLNQLCPVCEVAATNGIPVDVGGVLYYFATDEDIQKLEVRIEAQENIIDPMLNGLEPLPLKPLPAP